MTPGWRAAAFAPYALVGAVHVVLLILDVRGPDTVTKALLMPTLAVALFVLAGSRSGWLWAMTAALFFSWVGDIALNLASPMWFLIGLGAFLLAHLVYAGVFWRLTKRMGWRRAWGAVPYAVWWVALLALLAPNLGSLLIPVAVYGLVLAAMATLAIGVNATAAWGAGIFLASDTLLALGRFVDWFQLPAHEAWVIATYVVGQGLIVAGVVQPPARRCGTGRANVNWSAAQPARGPTTMHQIPHRTTLWITV